MRRDAEKDAGASAEKLHCGSAVKIAVNRELEICLF
jgi:hypothetical protein